MITGEYVIKYLTNNNGMRSTFYVSMYRMQKISETHFCNLIF
jgi:hypothetical protein